MRVDPLTQAVTETLQIEQALRKERGKDEANAAMLKLLAHHLAEVGNRLRDRPRQPGLDEASGDLDRASTSRKYRSYEVERLIAGT